MAILTSDKARWSTRWEGDKLHLLFHDAEKGLTPLDVELTQLQAGDLVREISKARSVRRRHMQRLQVTQREEMLDKARELEGTLEEGKSEGRE